MKEYISREAVQTVFNDIYDCSDMNFGERDNICEEVYADCASCRWLDTKKAIEKKVMEIPAADVVEVRHAYWQDIQPPDQDNNVQCWCSACGAGELHAKGMIVPYCWKCGAKMDGGADDA